MKKVIESKGIISYWYKNQNPFFLKCP